MPLLLSLIAVVGLVSATPGVPQEPTKTMERDAEIQRGMQSVQGAIAKAATDPTRPTFHFHAPALWMNDPNGPVFIHGWYHMFYQFNPYGDQWGHMHWGHARSRDMVNWEHLPIALWPTKSVGEDHVYSGSTFVAKDGVPHIFYTSIGDREPEQWLATTQDEDLVRWDKSRANPVLSQANHRAETLKEWRDPYLFELGGHTYVLCGGGLHGKGVVVAYRANDDRLEKWTYLGPIFEHPDKDVPNIECPNIVKIGSKWILLVSVHGRVESFVGTLDSATLKFTSEHRDVLAHGSYASQIFHGQHGAVIHYAWINTSNHHGWNGCLTLPSVLAISREGHILRKPIAELSQLRDTKFKQGPETINGRLSLPPELTGPRLEIETSLAAGTAKKVGLKVGGVTILWDVEANTLAVPGQGAFPLSHKRIDLKLHVFLDGQFLDVYANDGEDTVSNQLPHAPQIAEPVQLTAEGGSATLKTFTGYTLKPATFDLSRFK